ncbi:hypothetical protein SPRG_20943 [Saprolegnia parasitica CBS 223.65]|uniref:S1 motif domain-containing protein n=1 Tax=Saprolegnia parasitica (strain CBS 223.65) TaxID=695850 RepID=A0A067C0H4_SAPPC|nr:hypothetical protein SPRG_20943 [Saprolegnia parasitica CBS 223.65]KDO24033.1 hypothetical protein SPRG_20943 [Saprolegnia parasitica CBS 223.65]|eukprot:XP_012205267.1 hypothetical protein SPRG_20943 [Saprolegnia parasitica CBS 223.65]
MFFLKQLRRELLLHPMHFGPKLHDIIRLRLIEENNAYRAILFRPFKNEVLDAVVTGRETPLGFFAEVGPLQVFVSRHAMSTDLTEGYDHENSAWISQDREVEIRKGVGVRLKIMGVSIDVTEINAIGTIKDNYLGVISADMF